MTKNMKAKQRIGRQAHGLLIFEEAAAVLKTTRRNVHRLEADGKMPARVSVSWGSRKYYRLVDVMEMAARIGPKTLVGELKAGSWH